MSGVSGGVTEGSAAMRLRLPAALGCAAPSLAGVLALTGREAPGHPAPEQHYRLPSQKPRAAAATLKTSMPPVCTSTDQPRPARASRDASTHAVLKVV